MKEHIHIFDTTLRDGEQCPGAAMTVEQKVRIAMQLEALGVDVIEAGFPVISDGDFQAVRTVAERTESSRVCGLARCVEKDILAVHEAVAPAGNRGRIHLVLATSPIHRQYKMNKSREEILAMAVKGVSLAAGLCREVQFSAEDASRTEPDFLAEVVEAVIGAGASIVNIPDTVGYTMPDEFHRLISYLKSNVPNVDRAVISVHCHDDMGDGRGQFPGGHPGRSPAGGRDDQRHRGTGRKHRSGGGRHGGPFPPDFFSGLETGIRTRELVKTSRIVAEMSGMAVPRSKAVVGANAFSHGSGIHQDGILKNRSTYEIMNPEEIGWGPTELPLTKHSGRHAVKMRLDALGFSIPEEDMPRFFELFKQRGDRCKFVYDDDLSDMARSMLA